MDPNIIKVSEKTNEPISKKLPKSIDGGTEGRTDPDSQDSSSHGWGSNK